MFLIQSVRSPSCSGEEELGALACHRVMWCGMEQSVTGKINTLWLSLVDWLGWGFLVGNVLSSGWQQSELRAYRLCSS